MSEADIARALAPRTRKRKPFGARAMAAVVQALEKGATIVEAAKAAGHGPSTVYAWRSKSAAFAEAWEKAVEASSVPMLVTSGKNRKWRLARPRRTRFGRERKITFLEHFAASCDVTASAREAGVSLSTVYAHRHSDRAFAEAWGEALIAGYARLEAEMLRQRLEAQRRIRFRGDKVLPEEAQEFDRVMQLLREHKRSILQPGGFRPQHGARVGCGAPVRISIEEARDRLEAAMRKLGIPIDPLPEHYRRAQGLLPAEPEAGA